MPSPPDDLPRTDVHTPDSGQPADVAAPTRGPTTWPEFEPPDVPEGNVPVVAGYQILGVLGRGGMGVVYQARQTKLDRLVALKMLLSGSHAAEEELARFQREVGAVARLQHPNVVQIYEVGDAGGTPFCALEFVEGGSLAQYLAGTPQLPEQAAAIMETIARAVHAAHERGIVHRDLKPGNVLLSFSREPSMSAGSTLAKGSRLSEATPKITDFGLAKRLGDESTQTASGAIVGTPSYMAPEQAAGKGHAVGPLSDVYALGAMLYECLTGRPPFKGATSADTLLQVLSQEPVSPRRLQPGVPRDLETICLKCLEKEPRKRYGNALEVADDLQRFLAGQPITARRASRWERAAKWARRRPAAATLALFALVALPALIGLIVALWINAERRAAAVEELEHAQQSLDESRQELEDAREQTKRQRGLADEQRIEVGRLQEVRRQELERANEARRQTEKILEEVRASEYISRMAVAERSWWANNPELTERNLELCPADLHHWEWRYLKRLCRADLQTVSGPRPVAGRGVALSPDGKHVATVFTVNRGGKLNLVSWGVKVWEAQTGREVAAVDLGVPFQPIRHLFCSTDGKYLATTGDDNEVKVWQPGQAAPIFTLTAHAGPASAVAFSPDGTRLATAGGREIKLWDGKTGKELYLLGSHAAEVRTLCISPDGKRLASGGNDREVKLWDVGPMPPANGPSRTLNGHRGDVGLVCFSPDGRRLATVGQDNVRLWDAASGKELFILTGHAGSVSQACFSPDSQRLATCSEDRTVQVWDVATGKRLFTLRGHGTAVDAVAYVPDGSRLLSVDQDNTLKIWDAANGRQGLRLPGAMEGVAFSPDGKRLALPSAEAGVVTVWDVTTGKASAPLRGPGGTVKRAVFDADGRRLAVAYGWGRKGEGTEVWLWDVNTGATVAKLPSRQDAAGPVALDAAGRYVALSREGKRVEMVEVATGHTLRTFLGQGDAILSVALSPDGGRIALASVTQVEAFGLADYIVQVHDVATGRTLFVCPGHKGSLTALVFGPKGDRLVSAGGDRTLMLWELDRPVDARLEEPIVLRPRLVLRGHTQPARGLAVSRDGKRLASVSSDQARLRGEVKLWDVPTGHEVLTLPQPGGDIAFSPDSGRLAIAGVDGIAWVLDGSETPERVACREAGDGVAFSPGEGLLAATGPGDSIALLDPRTGREVRRLKGRSEGNARGHTGRVRRAAFSADGKLLATAGEDRTVKLWDVATANLLHTCVGHTDAVLGVAFSPQGELLASASADESVRVWDAKTGKHVRTITGQGDRVLCVAFSPDGRRIASGGEDRTVRIWATASGRELRRLEHPDPVNGVAFSPGGDVLASGCEDGVVRLWDPTTGKEVRALKGHGDAVRDVAFSPDGKRLASAGWDRSAKVWDPSSGKELLNLLGHAEGVSAVAFGPDSDTLATAGADLTVRVWRVSPAP